MGGTQSLHTNGFDEALSLPTEEAARIALRTQQIIGFESGVTQTVDPLGGSYYIEALTNEIESKAYDYLQKIDDMGGAVAAIEAGYIQSEIAQSAYHYQKQIEDKTKIIVGQNKFVINETPLKDLFTVNDSIRKVQIEKINAIKQKRNETLVAQALQNISNAATDGSNLMPHILSAAEGYATLGEIADSLRNVYGEYRGL
jgi:methylmalonyl-CoA mutase N-terminal domain/subunit